MTFNLVILSAVLWMFLLWLDATRRQNATMVDVGWVLSLTMLGLIEASLVHSERAYFVFASLVLWGWRLANHLWFNRILSTQKTANFDAKNFQAFSAIALILALLKILGVPVLSSISGIFALIWGVRLLEYLYLKTLRHEDTRYARLRNAAGKWADLVFLLVFELQAVLALVFLLPVKGALLNQNPISLLDWLGLGISLACIYGEHLADSQLLRFKQNPENRGKTCNIGLWKYSRHPNYFFEWCYWASYIAYSWPGEKWYWSLVGFLLMYIFVRYLSGIPHTETQAASTRSDYADYQRKTSVLIPWWPRS